MIELASHLLAIATLLQTAELFQLRPDWEDSGIWSWDVLAQDYEAYPSWLRKYLGTLLSAQGFAGVLFVRFACSLILVLIPAQASLLGILFFTTWLIAIRWRGTFNGGSDSMTAIVALGLWIAQSFPSQTWIVRGAMGFIAVHLTASYFLAGLAKLKNSDWLSGAALPAMLRIPGYDSPPGWVRDFIDQPKKARLAAWGLIAFELGFPIAWLGPKFCILFLSAGFLFHLLNFKVLGLNRFVFAWLAAYPALYFWSVRISS